MSAAPVPHSEAALAARLRAAGCVFAEEEAALLAAEARSPGDLAALAERRILGEPLEYVLGWAHFCGRRIRVDPGVFVPRRRSEFLVDQARTRLHSGAFLLDLCCGTGAIGLVLAEGDPGTRLYAVDIDAAAVACARRNLAPMGGRVFEGDLYDPLPTELRGRLDVIVANAPYVPADEVALLPPEARDYEPHVALDGGPDGLNIQRRIIAGGPDWLCRDGRLLIETSDRQVAGTVHAFDQAGLECRVARSADLNATVVIGTYQPR